MDKLIGEIMDAFAIERNPANYQILLKILRGKFCPYCGLPRSPED